MKIYNTVSQQLEDLDISKQIKWYVCGPTVYDDAHLGHARTYIMNDILIKVLRYMNVDVKTIMNITDIDDKIIDRSLSKYGDSHKFLDLTEEYTEKFLEDLIKLGVEIPEHIKKVSNILDQIIPFILELIKNEYAYVELEGIEGYGQSVYFDTDMYSKKHGKNYVFKKAKNQGDFDDKFLKHKKKGQDFALWKGVKESSVGWKSPWGKGRPGWHTECATIINMFKGVDVHTGGIDLCFPHHENEIKQVHGFGLSSPQFLHIGHLHITGQKMSKSLKNFITIREFLDNDKKIPQLRYMFLQHHYRDGMDFTDEHFEQAQRQLHLLQNITETLNTLIKTNNNIADNYDTTVPMFLIEQLEIVKSKNLDHLRNDFQVHLVLKELHDFGTHIFGYISNVIDEHLIHIPTLIKIKKYYDELMNLLGISYNMGLNASNNDIMVDLISSIRDEVRKVAKQQKIKELWQLSDIIRNDMLKPLGYQIEDKGDNPSVWKRV